jgi:hypothetical protein
MPAPSTTPDRRGPTEVVSAGAYRAGQAVWLFRGSWRPGVVLDSSSRAVMVRYIPAAGRGTGVDTAIAMDLAVRDEPDPAIDS